MLKKTKRPKVSIIVVVYNGKELLPGLLKSLKRTTYSNYEMIFVDNASVDNSIKIIEKTSSKIKIVKNKINAGFAGGCNKGIESSSPESKYVIILNQDMYVHPDWISYLVNVAESNKKIAVVGYARLLPESEKIETLGNKGINQNLAKFKKIGAGDNLREFLDKGLIEVDFCLGLIKKSILDKIGLFDEKTFAMYEEIDLCRRIRDAGYKIVVDPRSKVWHFGSQSIKKTSAFRIYHSYRNRMRYVLKHNRGVKRILYFELLTWIYFYKILKFSFKRRFDCSWAIVRGIWWNVKNLGDYF